jgi:acyl-CoA reductase-like NAD-dependent aldehyde dehydrogenase
LAASSAADAFKTWRHTPVSVRQRVFFRLQELIHKNEARIVDAIVRENGKTVTDAKGDVFRGLEVVEYASGIGSQLMGETVEGVSKNVDTYSFKQPIGVAAGVCPFNFPVSVPRYSLLHGTSIDKAPLHATHSALLLIDVTLSPPPPGVFHVDTRQFAFVCHARLGCADSLMLSLCAFESIDRSIDSSGDDPVVDVPDGYRDGKHVHPEAE